MSIFIKEILDNKFEVIVNTKHTTKHIVMLSDKYYEDLTDKKISKKKLLEYSFQFLLDKESNSSILSFFKLETISQYFPDYENKIKKTLKS